MAVTTAFNGTLGYPYTVMDLGKDLATIAIGIDWLKSIDGGTPITGTAVNKAATADNYYTASMPSPFKDFTQNAESVVSMSPDAGFFWAFGNMDLSQSKLLPGQTGIPLGAYAKIGIVPNGAIGLILNHNNSDPSCTANYQSYQTGVLLNQSATNGLYDFNAFFDNNGGCYFFFSLSDNSKKGRLVSLGPNSAALDSYIGDLSPLKAYYLTDSPYQLKGNVTDAAGQPAPGRVVSAYDRETMSGVGSAVSGNDGNYQMSLGVKSGASVFVVCLDDDAPPNFEAQIVDRVAIV